MWLQQSDQYCRSVCAICSATLVRERLRRRFPPRDLLEVETVWDHCRVRLRDGRLLLARWKRTAACAWTRSTGCAEMSRAQMEQISRAYYAVIVADVRYDKTLKPNAKLLYAELTALCNQYGCCWATNEYFAGLYGLSPATISRLISQLERRGYIRCEMAATETGSERRIYAGAFLVQPLQGGIDENVKTPLDENSKGGLDKKVNPLKENNINKTPYSPPKGDGAVGRRKKTGSRRSAPKAAPDWKPERFARFWDYYPRGESKQAAIRAWDRLQPSDELIREMGQALRRQMESESWRAGVGIPYASTWLNNQRWTDCAKTPPGEESAPDQPLRGEGVTYL